MEKQKMMLSEVAEACKGIEHLIDYLLTDPICKKMNQLLISQIIGALLEIADKHDVVKEFVSNDFAYLSDDSNLPPQIMIDKNVSVRIENATGEWLNSKAKFLSANARFKVDYAGNVIIAKVVQNETKDDFIVAQPLFGQDIPVEMDDGA